MITDIAGNVLNLYDKAISISRYKDKYYVNYTGVITGMRESIKDDGDIAKRVCIDFGYQSTEQNRHWFSADNVVKVCANYQ